MFLTTRKTFNRFAKGFTLIELLIVIAIIGILAAAVLVAVNPAKRTAQARDAARKSDIGALATAVQAYYTTPGQGLYPTALNVLTTSGDMKQIPTDPTAGSPSYGYVTISPAASNTEVAIFATLESPTTTGGGTWLQCWRSSVGKITGEVTAGGCVAP